METSKSAFRGWWLGLLAVATLVPAEARSILRPPLTESADPAAHIVVALPFQARAKIMRMAWGDGGREIFAFVGAEDTLAIFDASTRLLRRELELQQSGWDLAPKTGLVAGNGPFSQSTGQRFVVADAKTGEVRWEIPKRAQTSRFSPDGKRLIALFQGPTSGLRSSTLEVFDALTGRPLSTTVVYEPVTNVFSIALLGEDHATIAAGESGSPCVFNLKTGKNALAGQTSVDDDEISPTDSVVSPNGRYVAWVNRDVMGDISGAKVCRLSPDGQVQVVLRQRSSEEDGYLQTAEFSLDSRGVAILSANRTRVYDLDSGEETASVVDGGQCGALSAGGARVAVACSQRIRVDRVDKPNPGARKPSGPGNFKSLALAPDGERLAVAGESGILIVDRKSGQIVREIEPPHFNFTAVALQFAPHGEGLYFSDGCDVFALSLEGKSKPARRIFHWNDGSTGSFGFDLTADGKTMVAMRENWASEVTLGEAFGDLPARIRDIALTEDPPEVSTLRLSPDGHRLFIGADFKYQVYELSPDSIAAEGKTSTDVPPAISDDLSKIVVAQDGDSPRDGNPAIRDVKTGKSIWEIPWSQARPSDGVEVDRVAIDASHGEVALAFSDEDVPVYGVAIFDANAHRLLRICRTQRGKIRRLVFSEDGHQLYAVHPDSSVTAIPTSAPEEAPKPPDTPDPKPGI